MSLGRHSSRIVVVQTVYAARFYDNDPKAIMETLLLEKKPTPNDTDFIEDRVFGILQNIQSLEETIAPHLRGGNTTQTAKIDVSILLLGAFEIQHRNRDVDAKVAMNESIELAKVLGASDNSSKLINGVLHKILENQNA